MQPKNRTCFEGTGFTQGRVRVAAGQTGTGTRTGCPHRYFMNDYIEDITDVLRSSDGIPVSRQREIRGMSAFRLDKLEESGGALSEPGRKYLGLVGGRGRW